MKIRTTPTGASHSGSVVRIGIVLAALWISSGSFGLRPGQHDRLAGRASWRRFAAGAHVHGWLGQFQPGTITSTGRSIGASRTAAGERGSVRERPTRSAVKRARCTSPAARPALQPLPADASGRPRPSLRRSARVGKLLRQHRVEHVRAQPDLLAELVRSRSAVKSSLRWPSFLLRAR